jgi:hypothetical protein
MAPVPETKILLPIAQPVTRGPAILAPWNQSTGKLPAGNVP